MINHKCLCNSFERLMLCKEKPTRRNFLNEKKEDDGDDVNIQHCVKHFR